MRPAARASDMAKAKHLLLLRRRSSLNPGHPLPPLSNPVRSPSPSRPKTLNPSSSIPRRLLCSDGLSDLRERILLLTEKPTTAITSDGDREDLLLEISALADALLATAPGDPPDPVLAALSASSLLSRSPSATVDLLSRLRSRPLLALKVFRWRRDHAPDASILPEEFAKAIALAGRAKDPDLAAGLFADARAAGLRDTRLYNALMAAYMYNGLTQKSLAAFDDLKGDPICAPTIVTYNILLSVFGRSMLVSHMEAVLSTVEQSGLAPNLNTYNIVIAAYVTAWMWDRMEDTFRMMEVGPVQPDASTHLLMLRGYAHAGNLEKMEKTYEIVRERINDREAPLLRAMICAYCKSSDPERVRKIEALVKYIPKHEYRPWLNVLLIRLYAQEGLVEVMECFISEAFHRNTAVTTKGVMRSIISSYFQCNAADRLAQFVKQAEDAGWRLCRSLYHCKMVMYGQQSRLEEMHGVLDEMEACNLDRTKKTLLIMYMAYSKLGRQNEVKTIVGMMWKHGFGTPEDAFLSKVEL